MSHRRDLPLTDRSIDASFLVKTTTHSEGGPRLKKSEVSKKKFKLCPFFHINKPRRTRTSYTRLASLRIRTCGWRIRRRCRRRRALADASAARVSTGVRLALAARPVVTVVGRLRATAAAVAAAIQSVRRLRVWARFWGARCRNTRANRITALRTLVPAFVWSAFCLKKN